MGNEAEAEVFPDFLRSLADEGADVGPGKFPGDPAEDVDQANQSSGRKDLQIQLHAAQDEEEDEDRRSDPVDQVHGGVEDVILDAVGEDRSHHHAGKEGGEFKVGRNLFENQGHGGYKEDHGEDQTDSVSSAGVPSHAKAQDYPRDKSDGEAGQDFQERFEDAENKRTAS